MEYIVKSQVNRKVKCALLLFDDFTERPIMGSTVKITVLDCPNIKAIRKNDGYFVIVDNEDKAEDILVEVPNFTPQKIHISDYSINPINPVIILKLKPNCSYPILNGYTALTGITFPQSTVSLTAENSLANVKLMVDYSQNSENIISIYQNNIGDMLLKEFKIVDATSGESENFIITEEIEKGIYRIKAPLKNAYRKSTAQISPVFSCESDNNGKYFLPIKFLISGNTTCNIIVKKPDNSMADYKTTLLAGKVTTLNLL